MTPSIEAFGDAAVRVTLPSGVDRAALLAALRATAGVIDAVVAERAAVVTFLPGSPPEHLPRALEQALATIRAPSPPRRIWTIEVYYDGVDLDAIAARAGLSPAQVVDLHTAPAYEVVAVGFLPGFAYLRGVDPRLVGPRRPSPRPRVPALAVAIAGPYTGVYPYASPGGWNLLGTAVGFSPFDATRGARLSVGDEVHFARAET